MSAEPVFIATHHDPGLAAASLLVAVFASYVALDLVHRMRATGGLQRRAWWVGGSFALGTGIWSMHFVDMLGFDAGMPLGYAGLPTAASWLSAVSAAAIALGFALHKRLSGPVLAGASVSMAIAICTMHYLGMSALDVAPGIQWRPALVVLSGGIAWGASAVALTLFIVLRSAGGARLREQGLAALVMGLAIGGMHYTGMAAAQLPVGSICRSASALGGQPLAVLVTVAALTVLGGALLLSISDTVARTREASLNHSLRKANLDLRAANDELHRRAFEDALSGLPNRALFLDRLEHAISRVERRATPAAAERLAVIFVDMDGFKPVNDTLGHGAGDAVLREIGQRLQTTAGSGDTVARLGGDEFVALIESRQARQDAVTLAQLIIQAMQRPFVIGEKKVTLSCSIGISIHPDHDATGHRLLACADTAMYAAKRAGGSTWVVYEPSMGGDVAEQVAMQQALRQAFQQNELMLYYQPKVDAQGGRLHGLEALLRWRHPERGLLSPAVFLPLAERFGMIGTIGNWVIEESCAQLARWERGGVHCRIAINISPQQLRQTDLAVRIRDALQRHHLRPSQLVCEITESAVMENSEEERGMLEQLAVLGVRLSIDDFGTGYSSLAHLRNIPAGQLKIDRSFVVDLADNADARAILKAIVQLAHALRLEVVAEGVETEAQKAALIALGCDLLQGYLIARAMPAHSVPAWIAGQATPPIAASFATVSD